MSKYEVGQIYKDGSGDFWKVVTPETVVLWNCASGQWRTFVDDIGDIESVWGPLVLIQGEKWQDALLEKYGEEAREYLKGLEDPISHPEHYTSHPSGVECIDITRHMGFLDGNVLKYLWRYSMKGGVEDLKKARQYLDWLIEKEETG